MVETFVIGEPVVKSKNPRNAWRLHVKVMHGDADKYETVRRDYYKNPNKKKYQEGEPQFKEMLAALQAFFALSWNDGCDEDKVEAAITKATEPFKNDPDFGGWDAYSDFIPRDITYNDGHCRPDNVKVTYFDEGGTEYKVAIPGKWTRH